jgi:hypothetical protein
MNDNSYSVMDNTVEQGRLKIVNVDVGGNQE